MYDTLPVVTHILLSARKVSASIDQWCDNRELKSCWTKTCLLSACVSFFCFPSFFYFCFLSHRTAGVRSTHFDLRQLRFIATDGAGEVVMKSPRCGAALCVWLPSPFTSRTLFSGYILTYVRMFSRVLMLTCVARDINVQVSLCFSLFHVCSSTAVLK